MLHPRHEAVLTRNSKTGQFEDKTKNVSRYQLQSAYGQVIIVCNGGRGYPYGPANARILADPKTSRTCQ